MSLLGAPVEGDQADVWVEWAHQKGALQDALTRHFQHQEALLARLQDPAHRLPLEAQRPARRSEPQGESYSVVPAFDQTSTPSSLSGPKTPEYTKVLPTSYHAGATGLAADDGGSWKKRNAKRRKDKLKFLGATERGTLGKRGSTLMESNSLVKRLHALYDWWVMLEEPPRSGALFRVVRHKYFDGFVASVILANTVYTTYQSNYEMQTLGDKPPGDMIFETCFLIVFIIELLGKIAVHKLYFFCNESMFWNIFDCILVLFSTVDQVFSYVGGSLASVSFARSLRLFKMGKILRVFRAFRFLKELRVMMNSILGSFLSLFWSIITLGMILFVFALFFMQQMVIYLTSVQAEADDDLWWRQRHYFFNVETSIATLAMCTTGGKDWEDIWVLIQPLGSFSAFAFSFYIAFFTFAVMNILTGIFVDNALQLCKPDDHEALCDHQKKVQKELEELAVIMEIMDANGSGTLSMVEFMTAMENDRVIHAMLSLGVDIKDAAWFFSTLAKISDSEEVSVEDFASQVIRMKGAASSIDLHGLILQTTSLQKDLLKLHDEHISMQRCFNDLSRKMDPRHIGVPSGQDRGGPSACAATPLELWCASRQPPPSVADDRSLALDMVHPLSPPEEHGGHLPSRPLSRGPGCLD